MTANKWVQVSISGEDETVAVNYLTKTFGACPATLENVKRLLVFKGYITKDKNSEQELTVDIGVFHPKPLYAEVPLKHLQTQLVNGKDADLKKIVELFALSPNLPLKVRVKQINEKEDRIEAEISSSQTRKLMIWRDSLLDRLLISGASTFEIMKTVENMMLARDVIDIEPLGLFEHALTCKLGTDAAGLIRKIARPLRKATFTIFNARRIIQFMEN